MAQRSTADGLMQSTAEAETLGRASEHKESHESNASDDVKIDAVEILGDWHLRQMISIIGIIMEVEHAWPLG